MQRCLTSATLGLSLAMLSLSCSGDDPTPSNTPPAPLAPGQSREVELRYLALDVEGFSNQLTFEELDPDGEDHVIPREILEQIWLVDLDLTPLMLAALEQLEGLPEAELDPPARNLQKLLLMTPSNAELDGTSLETLVDQAQVIGIPKPELLAPILGIGPDDPIIPREVVARVMLRNVVGSHPNAQWRPGPADAAHPDGRWPVIPEGAIPLSLADVITGFADMATRFGPVGEHPGFVDEVRGLSVIDEESFLLTTKVEANALPFKGVDLRNASVASVNSIGSQIATVHDFSDPEWLTIDGLVPDPRVQVLGLAVFEDDAFIDGGSTCDPGDGSCAGTGSACGPVAPVGTGDSPVWRLPEWALERLVVEMGREVENGLAEADLVPRCETYPIGQTSFDVRLDENGWLTMSSPFADIEAPPPTYLHDLVLEIAQARLHDGGLAEGQADAVLRLRDVEVGVSSSVLIERARENLEQNPESLRAFAYYITNSTHGDADFYHVWAQDDSQAGSDWLYWVTEDDLRLDDHGEPVRAYGYDAPGFFADPELTEKRSSTAAANGDDEHEKLRIVPGMRVYAQDDDDARFEIEVLDKPSRARIRLRITRLD